MSQTSPTNPNPQAEQDVSAEQDVPAELGAEDRKILTLARATRARTGAPEGAAVRDTTGRTYTAATVGLPSLELSALRLAVAMALSSGAEGLEAAALVVEAGAAGDDTEVRPDDLAAVRDLGGAGVPVFVAGPDGEPRAATRT